MQAQVLFAGTPVRDFARARDWYDRFFGRAADVVAHEREQMWRVTETGWLYIVEDADHAGNGLAAVAVPDLEAAIAALHERGIAAGPITHETETSRKAVVTDPDGNSIALIEVDANG